MILSEQHSSSSYVYDYSCKDDLLRILNKRSHFHSIGQRLKEVFLPQGYPDSVSKDYLEYQIWDTIQALASTVTSTIAHQAVLKGFGVGDNSATILGATMTWIMKDGTGLIGRIVFAYWKGTFLDCNCKRWRLFADVVNDISIFTDILSSYLPRHLFPFLICTTSLGRSLVGVAGGATRAALTLHQARRNNMADVSAKDGSQESLSNLVGLMLNVSVVYLITGNNGLIAFTFFLLTSIHLFANYRAVKAVTMSSFNQSRFHFVVKHWLATRNILSIKKANLAEPVWSGLCRQRVRQLDIGSSVCTLSPSMIRQMHATQMEFQNEGYLLLLDSNRKDNVKISILLKKNSSYFDQLKSVFHCELVDFCLSNSLNTLSNRMAVLDEFRSLMVGDSKYINDFEIVVRSLHISNQLFKLFKESAESIGWDIGNVYFGADEWRINRLDTTVVT